MKNMLKIIALTAVTFGGGYAFADSITKPNTFTPGTAISSSSVNANFDTVYGQVNKIGSVISTDQVNNRLVVGGNLWNKEGILTIESNPNGTFSSGYGGHHIVLVNPTATSTTSDGNLNKAAITKLSDGSLHIYSYTGAGAGEDKPTVFHRNGTANTEVMRIHSNGNVGIGTTAPEKPLHIVATDNSAVIRLTNAAGVVGDIGLPTTGGALYESMQIGTQSNHFLILSTNGGAGSKIVLKPDGNIGIGRAVDQISYPLHMASGAYVTTGGTWTNASSREFKDNINALSLDSARTTLEQLNPVTFTYKKEPDGQHVGFIAEDVPDLVATKDRKGLSSMDIVAVVTKIVQDQQVTIKHQDEAIQKQDETIKAQGSAIQKQEKEIQALTAMLQQTLASMSTIQHKVSQIEAAQKMPMLQKASHTEMVH
ncbi:MAG TPA: hypothetical protein HPQ00_16570 [Magnetococcales bacterium]|nr:hypothetical protein [Magnetococcales bacterium]